MASAFPRWPGFVFSNGRRPGPMRPMVFSERVNAAAEGNDLPDIHTQLEDLLSHVRRCERWARLDDRIDLALRLDKTI